VQVKYKGYEKLAFSDQSRFISKMVQDTAILTMEDVCDLSTGAIFNDLE